MFFFSFLGPSRSTRGTGLGPYRVHKSAIYFQKWDRFGTVPKNFALKWDRFGTVPKIFALNWDRFAAKF